MYAGSPPPFTETDAGEDRLRTEWYAPRVDGVKVPVTVLVPNGCDNVTRVVEVKRALAEVCRTFWGPGRLVKSRVGFRWERDVSLVA